MIVTKTPFRITLGGGGTDLPSYYKEKGGFIFAMTIDKYMFITLHETVLDKRIWLHYSKTEKVERTEEIEHDIARETLKMYNIESGPLSIASHSDLPSHSGMGSSSAYAVGLLRALDHMTLHFRSTADIAEAACNIEMNVLKKGIGKQDQYMASYGGMKVLRIDKDGKVNVADVRTRYLDLFYRTVHIYYIGGTRAAEDVLKDQNQAMLSLNDNYLRVSNALDDIKSIGGLALSAFQSGAMIEFGNLMHEHWLKKKTLSQKVSVTMIDELYDELMKDHGVIGGKIIGAGGGGCLMLSFEPHRAKKLENTMRDRGFPRIPFALEKKGSQVIFYDT